MALKIKTEKYKNKEGEQKSIDKMKIQGKLMDDGEKRELVCLVDEGLRTRTIKYKDKKTGEQKSFEKGEIFSTEDNEDERAFVAGFTGQALKEIKKVSDKLGKGVHYEVTKNKIEIKKTGAIFPIVKIRVVEPEVTTTTTSSSSKNNDDEVELIGKEEQAEDFTDFEKR